MASVEPNPGWHAYCAELILGSTLFLYSLAVTFSATFPERIALGWRFQFWDRDVSCIFPNIWKFLLFKHAVYNVSERFLDKFRKLFYDPGGIIIGTGTGDLYGVYLCGLSLNETDADWWSNIRCSITRVSKSLYYASSRNVTTSPSIMHRVQPEDYCQDLSPRLGFLLRILFISKFFTEVVLSL
mgnify:FL=1